MQDPQNIIFAADVNSEIVYMVSKECSDQNFFEKQTRVRRFFVGQIVRNSDVW